MHRVVVVGAGFGGLSAARALIGEDVDVTVVDQRNFHTFQPLLYEVATAGLESGDVAYPIRVIFGKADNVTFRMAAVTGVDWERREVLLAEGHPLPFDSLIVASGATARFFGIPGASEYSFPLYTLTDARRLRDHILRRLEDVDAHPEGAAARGALTFVVVGGGPTGVEVAGALAELLDVAVRHDGFRFERSAGRIILIDALDRLLTPFRESASAYAADTLTGRGIELRLGDKVKSVGTEAVELEDGTVIPTRTVVWAGGVTVEHTVAAEIDAPTGANGRLVVDHDLGVVGRLGVYGVGDAAAVLCGGTGPDAETVCPQVAQVAIQSGGHAARQILAAVADRQATPFAYKDKGIMATIGRRAAVTQFRSGRVIRGTLGWLAWLGLHLVYLVGFRNKIVVFINWTWRYLSWGSGPRIIVSEESVTAGDGDVPTGP
ncbi:MAG TPA: NAD(P)/FAD-dependent oxidoreductase [Acidimicrobiales bacterium]